jgi:tRNA pseudouridine55 synthase
MKRSPDKFHGLLLLNKPQGITSHDAVDRVRRILVQRGVGHAGTLDPAADGLLVLLVGRGTKAARFFSDYDKEYLAEITLGAESTTYDAEGVIPATSATEVTLPDRNQIETALQSFLGTITQQVPAYSAVHVDGERLYEKARRGEDVVTPERTVRIDSIDILEHNGNRLRVRVCCGKGTYIRSLAHDLGKHLGCGAYLSALTRTSTGRFRLEQSRTLEALEDLRTQNKLAEAIIPIDEALGFTCLTVGSEFGPLVHFGRRPTAGDIAAVHGEFESGDHLLLKDQSGSLLAIATATMASTSLKSSPGSEILTYERVLA